jgi:cytochrome P450
MKGRRVYGPLPPGPRAPAAVNMARLVQRPLESLVGWRERYGDVYTVPLLVFGVGVYVSDPAAIREMLTGDQSDLHAGEANAPLSPVLGDKSVLILDGREHLRQRKLLLPPFQGSAIQNFRTVIREVAEAEVIRTVVSRVDLEPTRPEREPVVMRGITLVPRHGTPVRVGRVARAGTKQGADQAAAPAA